MVDSNIAMQGRELDVGTPIRQAQQDANNNALSAEQTLKYHYENMGERDKRRLQSTIVGASQLKTYLDRDDAEGAHEFLMNRQKALQQRMANGEDVDDQETAYALDKLRRGDLDGLKNDVAAMMAAGQAYGVVGGSGVPASVQEWQYYNSLSPKDQARWKDQKRAGYTIDLGDKAIRVDGGGQQTNVYEKSVTPDNKPENAGAKAEAVAAGTAAGEQQGANAKKEYDSKANRNYIEKALTLLPKATSGALQTGIKQGAQAAGISTEASRADRQLSILSSKLVGTVPRFEGPQGVLDVELYKQAAGDLANTELPIGDRIAAAELMLDLIDEYGATGTGGAGAPQGGGMIRVGNGTEIREIDPADLPAAQAEGYTQQ